MNNKDADQPAHLCSLISTFVIRLLESIIYKILHKQKLDSVAKETGLSLTVSETRQTGFVMFVMYGLYILLHGSQVQ